MNAIIIVPGWTTSPRIGDSFDVKIEHRGHKRDVKCVVTSLDPADMAETIAGSINRLRIGLHASVEGNQICLRDEATR